MSSFRFLVAILAIVCMPQLAMAQTLRTSTPEITTQEQPQPVKKQAPKPAPNAAKPAAKIAPAKPPAPRQAAKKPDAPSGPKPLQLTPQTVPQTKAAPDAVIAPAMALPQQAPPPPGRGGLMRRYDPFTPAQRTTLTRINEVYNAAQEMNGAFTQVESDGTASSGRFFISKPGRIRFVYDPPSNLDIVADGTQLAIRDKKLGTQDVYQLWQTPLRYLLKEKIDLLEDARIVSILQDTNVVTVSIDENAAMTQGRLTLYFSASDYKLQQWTITDGRGVETSVVVAKLELNKPNDQRLFALQ